MNKQEKRAYDNLVQKHTEDTEKLVKIRNIALEQIETRLLFADKRSFCDFVDILEIIGE